jgi:hypothetical protein
MPFPAVLPLGNEEAWRAYTYYDAKFTEQN